MGLPVTKVAIPKVQTQDRNVNQLQQNIIDAFNKLQQRFSGSGTSDAGTVIGESKSAYLTEAQFQSQSGTNWVLQDGRSCIGTAYETLTGNKNVPNACGRTLRMADNSQGVNPDGNLALGSNQSDAFASHTHDLEATGLTGQIAAGSFSVVQSSETLKPSGLIGATGGNETRMKNTTINFFIRIN